jgi:hypothetical protein
MNYFNSFHQAAICSRGIRTAGPAGFKGIGRFGASYIYNATQIILKRFEPVKSVDDFTGSDAGFKM